MSSGYQNCACRDCFEIAIGDGGGTAVCLGCEAAGCADDPGFPEAECQAPHAYCGADEQAEQNNIYITKVAHCPVCGQRW